MDALVEALSLHVRVRPGRMAALSLLPSPKFPGCGPTQDWQIVVVFAAGSRSLLRPRHMTTGEPHDSRTLARLRFRGNRILQAVRKQNYMTLGISNQASKPRVRGGPVQMHEQ